MRNSFGPKYVGENVTIHVVTRVLGPPFSYLVGEDKDPTLTRIIVKLETCAVVLTEFFT